MTVVRAPAGESPTISLTQSTPQIAGKKLLLAFAPLTQADRDVVTSFVPRAHADGTPVQASEFPSSLPAYLIRLGAEVRIDEQVAMSGGSFNLGQELVNSTGVFIPGTGWVNAADNFYVAGDLRAIGIDLQGLSDIQLQQLKQKLDSTKSKIESFQVSGLSTDAVPGDLLQSQVLGYFSLVNTYDEITAAESKVVRYRLPSFGTVALVTKTFFSFGVPRAARPDGIEFDINRLAVMAAHVKNNSAETRAYLHQIGSRASAFEHLVPERSFAGQSDGEGVSAVKALAVASSTGQRIFLVSNQNVDTALATIAAPADLESEIQNAVFAGKQVIVSERAVAVGPWTGFGYIIIDQDTGAGAYKISGGTNGGKLSLTTIITWTMFFAMLLGIFIMLVLAFATASPLFLVGAYLFTSLFLLDAGRKAWPSPYKNFLESFGKSLAIGGIILFLLQPQLVVPIILYLLFWSVAINYFASLI